MEAKETQNLPSAAWGPDGQGCPLPSPARPGKTSLSRAASAPCLLCVPAEDWTMALHVGEGRPFPQSAGGHLAGLHRWGVARCCPPTAT